MKGIKNLEDSMVFHKIRNHFASGSVSIPVFAINKIDGERLNIRTGDIIILETPFRKRVKGKAFLTEEIMPGVIKTAFGPGGQKASGLGFQNNLSEYTPNINECCDPENISPIHRYAGVWGYNGEDSERIVLTREFFFN